MENETTKTAINGNLTRQLLLYFGGLIAVYVIAVIAFWDAEPKDGLFIFVMFAPTVGALLARFFGGGKIQFGRPGWWLLAGLIPTAAVLVFYFIGSLFGVDSLDPGTLVRALIASPLAIFTASLSAVGEEIGWRGFLWPLLRKKNNFLRTSLIVAVVWWLYHVPLILFGWYGSVSGIPAFSVAIIGFVLFIGVVTDRARSLWPSVIAHGAWNGLVSTGFAVSTLSGVPLQAFTGSTTWVGEFGWLAAMGSLLVGLVAAVWHIRN